ncbi:hypothetical protein ACEPAH_6406 [Sanghuangporus vaninii]
MVLSTQTYADPSVVRAAVFGYDTMKKLQLVVVTALAYDAIVTMDQEIKYFWRTPRSTVQFLYFANRYIGILGAIAGLVGNFSIWTNNIVYWISLVAVNYILMLRVLALYSQDKRLAICLKTILISAAAFEFVVIIRIILLEHLRIVVLIGNVTFCGSNSNAQALGGVSAWLILALYGIVLTVLALYKALQYRKMQRGSRASMLVTVLLRDQAAFCVLVIICSLLNIGSFVSRDLIFSSFLGNPCSLFLVAE